LTQRLRFDDSTRVLREGRMVVGGRPARLLHLTAVGGRCVNAWRDGAAVGDSAGERRLAARLIDAGLAHPVPVVTPWTSADVAVVIPARDRAEQLAECLRHLGPVDEIVVVDDGSADGRAIESVAREAGAGVLRLDPGAGPAAARNAGLAATRAPLVAFIDSDARPQAGWLEPLLAQFADERAGAVAPRIRVPPGRSTLGAYEVARSPLDMGNQPGIVGHRRRIRFVPATALLVRRDAFQEGFDSSLRFGEDVDFVWRLAAGGWTVRYEPEAVIEHPHRRGACAWLQQRIEYGSSAAPLAKRHAGELSHLVLPAAAVPALVLLVAGRPRGALLALLGGAAVDLVGLPAGLRRELAPLACRAQLRVARQLFDAAWRAYPPLVLVAAARSRRVRRLAFAGLGASIAADWLERRPRLDPLRFGALRLTDDLAYATGVWWGCVSAREAGPLTPGIVLRSSSRRTVRR
jgi:mycofactocin glycosyltransferase